VKDHVGKMETTPKKKIFSRAFVSRPLINGTGDKGYCSETKISLGLSRTIRAPTRVQREGKVTTSMGMLGNGGAYIREKKKEKRWLRENRGVSCSEGRGGRGVRKRGSIRAHMRREGQGVRVNLIGM